MITNIPELSYLNVNREEELEQLRLIYENEHDQVFNKNEFEFVMQDFDYIQSGIVNQAFNTIVDLFGVGDMIIDFGDDRANEFVNSINYVDVIERFLLDAKTYGNAYLHITTEPDLTVSEDKQKISLYKVDNELVYADYDVNNLQKDATKYSIVYDKKIDDSKVAYLIISFQPGTIIYESILKEGKNESRVDAFEHFSEFKNKEVNYIREGDTYKLRTNLLYSNLQAFHYQSKKGEFYGSGDITKSIISKINAINRLSNLSQQLVTDNSQAPLQLSQRSHKNIEQAIQEVTGRGQADESTYTLPTSLDNDPTSQYRINAVNFQEHRVRQIAKKKLMHLESDGRGENSYLTNPTSIEEPLKLKQKIFDELASELYYSQVFYNHDVSIGAKSGVALDLLLSTTYNHVNKLRNKVKPILQRVFYCLLETAQESKLDGTDYTLDGLPQIEFPSLTQKTAKEKIDEWASRVQNGFNTQSQAIHAINPDFDEEDIKEVESESNSQPENLTNK